MAEIVYYRNRYRESGPLLAAMNRLGLQNFARSRNLIITRTRFPDWFRYRKVTGFRGSYCAGRLDHWINWTIHWDYDPIKGPHVNLLIQDNYMRETLRFAFCESHGPHPLGRAPETHTHEFTLNRLTSDCGYDCNYWRDIQARRGDGAANAYLQECGRRGQHMWCARLGA